jgi:putative nucleic acid binding protein
MSSALSSLLIVIGLWLCMAVFCCAGGDRSQRRDLSNQQAAIITTAPDLINDYKANEIAADQRYKGRVVQVSGAVDSIGKDIMDSMYLTLSSGEEFGLTSVQCFFNDSAGASLARLQKGERVTVICVCDGKFGNVILKDCALR